MLPEFMKQSKLPSPRSATQILFADNIISLFLTIYLICLMKILVKLGQVVKQMRNICVQDDITA